jgi:uncharacterized membrane protein
VSHNEYVKVGQQIAGKWEKVARVLQPQSSVAVIQKWSWKAGTEDVRGVVQRIVW